MTFSIDTDDEMEGWMLCFHPDLIRGTNLGRHMDQFTFFTYRPEEALHLSHEEKETITSVVRAIKTEYSINLDGFSHKLLISNLETLLNYCGRYYSLQFVTRTTFHADTISQFHQALNQRFREEELKVKGIPTVREFADICYSIYVIMHLGL